MATQDLSFGINLLRILSPAGSSSVLVESPIISPAEVRSTTPTTKSTPTAPNAKGSTPTTANGTPTPIPAPAKTQFQEQQDQLKKTVQQIKNTAQKSVSSFASDLKLTEDYGDSVFYRIIYEVSEGKYKTYNFVLLPARETKVGNWNVPDAKPGVPVMAAMKHKIFTVPGSGPLVQTVGIAGTTFNLVGALIGLEVTDEDFAEAGIQAAVKPPNPSPVAIESGLTGLMAYKSANDLLTNVFYPGRAVTVEVKGAGNFSTVPLNKLPPAYRGFIRYTGVIRNAKVQFVHGDRVYYNLELFVTSYPKTITEPASYYDFNTAQPKGSTAVVSAESTTNESTDTSKKQVSNTASTETANKSKAAAQQILFDTYLADIRTKNSAGARTLTDTITNAYDNKLISTKHYFALLGSARDITLQALGIPNINDPDILNVTLTGTKNSSNPVITAEWSKLVYYSQKLISLQLSKRSPGARNPVGALSALIKDIDSGVVSTLLITNDSRDVTVNALRRRGKTVNLVTDPGFID